ncbi:MAG TPA: hypothetical protein V6C85_14485 [Allocoleopsis sp.]
MTESYFVKNLPTPVQALWRPMLLISIGLHGLLLVTPTPSEQKPQTPQTKKEPEKVKITQIPTTPKLPIPKTAPTVTPKPSPVVARPQPQPIRSAAPIIPAVSPRSKVIPRPQAKPTPEQKTPSPTPSPTPQAATSPSPTPQATPSPTVQDPFADFPFPSGVQPGSLGLLPADTDKAARNTTEKLEQVVAFYNQELSNRKYTAKPLTDEADLKVYEVSKDGGAPQYLHLISKDGKTVILLASQQVSDLKSLKSAETRSPEELAFYDAVKQLENDENLALAAVEPSDISKFPEPDKFNDANKFEFRSKTVPFKPMSPDELYAQVEAKLSQSGFSQISKEATYGGGQTYKITQGSFTRYLYFVPTSDNRTVVILSKDSPFQ